MTVCLGSHGSETRLGRAEVGQSKKIKDGGRVCVQMTVRARGCGRGLLACGRGRGALAHRPPHGQVLLTDPPGSSASHRSPDRSRRHRENGLLHRDVQLGVQ